MRSSIASKNCFETGLGLKVKDMQWQTPNGSRLTDQSIAKPVFLNEQSTLINSLRAVCSTVSHNYPSIDRIALTVFESHPGDGIKTRSGAIYELGYSELNQDFKMEQVAFLQPECKEKAISLSRDGECTAESRKKHNCFGRVSDYLRSLYFEGNIVGTICFSSSNCLHLTQDLQNLLELVSTAIEQKYAEYIRTHKGIENCVQIISRMVHVRDSETGLHLDRISAYSYLIAEKVKNHYNLSNEYVKYIHLFACLHDIGKVGIPDSILLKQGRLTHEEWLTIQSHVSIGEGILDHINDLITQKISLARTVLHNIVSGHHERGDGSGYPRGLKMDQIPIEARIVAVADVFDALSNHRSYKQAWPFDRVKTELLFEAACNRLDQVCVDALLSDEESLALVKHCFYEHQF